MARTIVPDYGTRPATTAEINGLLDAAGVRVYDVDMEDVAFVTPPIAGKYELYISSHLRAAERAFWTLHELAHFLAGDADEPMRQGDYDPYPPWERNADAFAALGILPPKERRGDTEWLTMWLLRHVPTQHIAWTRYRAPATAAAVVEWLNVGEQIIGDGGPTTRGSL